MSSASSAIPESEKNKKPDWLFMLYCVCTENNTDVYEGMWEVLRDIQMPNSPLLLIKWIIKVALKKQCARESGKRCLHLFRNPTVQSWKYVLLPPLFNTNHKMFMSLIFIPVNFMSYTSRLNTAVKESYSWKEPWRNNPLFEARESSLEVFQRYLEDLQWELATSLYNQFHCWAALSVK